MSKETIELLQEALEGQTIERVGAVESVPLALTLELRNGGSVLIEVIGTPTLDTVVTWPPDTLQKGDPELECR